MTESRIKEYKDSELEQLFKHVENILSQEKPVILKEASEDSLEQKINDWVTSTIDDWRSSWDDSPDGARAAKYDLETAYDWFWDNIADFENKYDYVVEEDDQKFDDCLTQTVNNYVEETLQDLRDSWDHFDDDDDDDIWDPAEEDDDDEYWDEVHASAGYLSEAQRKKFPKAVITPQDVVSDYLNKHPEAKNREQELITYLTKLQKQDPNTDLNAARDEYLAKNQAQATTPQPAQAEAAPQANLLTAQDAKLGQGYLMKTLNTGDISNQINQLLPKISPTFKGNKFQVTKVEPMAIDQKDPNSMKFKVSFNLVSGSGQADKLVASQDPAINRARQFLNSLQEEQLNEGLAGAIGKAVGNVVGAVKRGAQNVAAGFSNADQANMSSEYIQMAANKEPLLQQYLPKILNQAFADDLNINGKQFQVTIPKIALKKDSSALKNLQKNTAKDKAGNKAEDQAQTEGQTQAKGQAQAKGQKVTDNTNSQQPQQQPEGQDQKMKDSQHKNSLYTQSETRFNEGSVVKGGSFILDLTLAGNASSGTNAGLSQQFATPDNQSQQGSQQTQQTQAVPAGQNINIYTGTPQQGQQQAAQNNGTPFWYNDMSKRQQKKFIRNQLKNPRQAKAPGQNNLWGMTYDNGGKYGTKFA